MPDFEIPELSEDAELFEIKKMLRSIRAYTDSPGKAESGSSAFEEVTALKTLPTQTVVPATFLGSPASDPTPGGWPGWVQFLGWSALALITAVAYFFVYALYIVPN